MRDQEFITQNLPEMKKMAKKKFLSALALCIYGLTGFSQTPKVNILWGAEFEVPKKHESVGFVGNPKDGYTEISTRYNEDLILQKIEPGLQSNTQEKIDLTDMPPGYMNDGFYNLKGNEYWFFSTWEKKEEKEILHYQKLNLKSGKFEGERKTIIESDRKLAGNLVATGFYQFNVANKYPVFISCDSSKILIKYRLKPEERKDELNYDMIGLNVFDYNMNKIWGRVVRMPYTEARMNNLDYQIDKNGTVYILTQVYEGLSNKEQVNDKPNYHFEILKYDKEKTDATIIPFKLENVFCQSPTIKDDKNGNLLCSGYYKKVYNGGTDGVFLLKLESGADKLTKLQKGYYEFSDDVLKQFLSERAQKRLDRKIEKGKELSAGNLEFRQYHINPDGSITVIGEVSYIITTTHYDGKRTYTTTSYYYEDIMVMSIDASGNMNWCRKIPKRQVGNNGRGGMSFKYLPKDNATYLFFLDNNKNAKLPTNKEPKVHVDGRTGMMVCVKIDSKGNVERSDNLFDQKVLKKYCYVADFDIVAPGQMINRAFRKTMNTPVLFTVE